MLCSLFWSSVRAVGTIHVSGFNQACRLPFCSKMQFSGTKIWSKVQHFITCPIRRRRLTKFGRQLIVAGTKGVWMWWWQSLTLLRRMSCLVLEHIVPRVEHRLAVIYIFIYMHAYIYFLLGISILPDLLNLNCFPQVRSSRFFFREVAQAKWMQCRAPAKSVAFFTMYRHKGEWQYDKPHRPGKTCRLWEFHRLLGIQHPVTSKNYLFFSSLVLLRSHFLNRGY